LAKLENKTLSTATIPTESPEKERRKMIADRQKNSVVWRIIHRLGSLQLALSLMATIAIACAIATVAESEFSAKVAQTYIYKAPWFIVWLGVLCINLLSVTLTRWPWQRKHTGFIITHYGLITVLIGATIGLHAGFEGNVILHTEKPPVRKITVNRSIIQLESPKDTGLYVMTYDAAVTPPSEKRPRVFPVPMTNLQIVATGFSDNLLRTTDLVPATSGGAGVKLRLTSARMEQKVELPLLLEEEESVEEDFFELATISLAKKLPAAIPTLPSETQMIFAHYAPFVQSAQGQSAVNATLSEDGTRLSLSAGDATSVTYLRSEIMGQPIVAGASIVTVEEYWPDFEMKEGRPRTKSPLPNNPAALVRISTAENATAVSSKPQLVLAVVGDTLQFQLMRDGKTYASGVGTPGKAFALGWADWQAEVVQFFPQATKVTTTAPGPALEDGAEGIPGFRARLESAGGPQGKPQWVQSGDVTTLTDGVNVVRIGYGLELRPVPFSIRLKNFEVPRYEGTETPSNWIATVEFQDAMTGATKEGTARMNHPASFPGTLFANFTGINYKFSQAEWNPRDLNETTLQVLYDPGWFLKWFGSLCVCVGIAIMFYLKPKTS